MQDVLRRSLSPLFETSPASGLSYWHILAPLKIQSNYCNIIMSAGALDHLSMFGLGNSTKAKNSWESRSWEPSAPLASGLESVAEFPGVRNDWGSKTAWDWEILELFQEKSGDPYQRVNEWRSQIAEGVDLPDDGYKLHTKSFAKESAGASPATCSSGIQEFVACGHDSSSASSHKPKPVDAMNQLGLENMDRYELQDHQKKDFLVLRGGKSPVESPCKLEDQDIPNGAGAFKGDSPIGLKLGNCTYFGESVGNLAQTGTAMAGSKSSFSTRKKRGSSSKTQVPRCQVDTCKIDLSKERDYHRRHKVCPKHSKSSKVIAAGIEQRFCQQCSRFHVLSEFDEEKRSCRRRLAGHNERRRKPQHNYKAIAPAGAVTGLQNEFLQRTLVGDRCFMPQEKSFSAPSVLDGTYYNDWNPEKTKFGSRFDHAGFARQMNPDYKWLMLLQPKVFTSSMGILGGNQINSGSTHVEPALGHQDLPIMHRKAALGSQFPSETSNSGCALSLLSSQAWGAKAPNSLSLDLLPQSSMLYESSVAKDQDTSMHGLKNFFVSNEKLLSIGPHSQKIPGGMNVGAVDSVFEEQKVVVPDVAPSFGNYSLLSFQQQHQFGSLEHVSENTNTIHVRPMIDLMHAAPTRPIQDNHVVLQGVSPPISEHFGEYQPFRVFRQNPI
ncbi:hypothetical protein O6H91_10G032900 [Diphasiastrum complanatum]|uniref:Uncharacterized protein n=1 Tax=Diphasiastrum complanatum TaxID=34168 RepID=A0ACC2CFY7_DIPCM|nr:hypothetical protein O6H91_10G032900 [Diphasiastrum complanatum]